MEWNGMERKGKERKGTGRRAGGSAEVCFARETLVVGGFCADGGGLGGEGGGG